MFFEFEKRVKLSKYRKQERRIVPISKFVILGGGMVAGYAARQLTELGLRPDELTVVSADSSIPYERPPLSKTFLAGKDSEENVRINPDDFYRDNGIQIRLQTEVVAVSP